MKKARAMSEMNKIGYLVQAFLEDASEEKRVGAAPPPPNISAARGALAGLVQRTRPPPCY